MTTPLAVLAPARRTLSRLPVAVPAAVGVLLLVRVLEFSDGASPDEGGFLVVAGQWHAGGSSLYGNYWVDRPPLLIGLYRLADLAGGLLALRVIGALAAAVTVLLLASTAQRVFGRRAATWAAVASAALLISPLYGSIDVNGELLAVPFVALGLRAAVEAVLAEDRLIARAAALIAGGSAVAALLVKQNVADVLVFTAVCWVLAWRQRRITGRELRNLIGLAALGSVLAYAVVMLSAMAHGTSPEEVYQATYPFRIEAAKVIANSTSKLPGIRLHRLGEAFVLSGAPLVAAAFAVFGLRRSRASYVAWALVAMAAWSAVSILAGGSYWLHYLVESVPVVALAAGAISLSAPKVTRLIAAVLVISAAIAAGAVQWHPVPRPGEVIGDALSKAEQPGDTMISLFGEPDLLRNTGMSSPYPYLWSLPSRTLDPAMEQLHAVLSGSNAPTWLVVRGPATTDRLNHEGILPVIDQRYRRVARICQRIVYLRRDVSRPVPVATGSCSGLVLP